MTDTDDWATRKARELILCDNPNSTPEQMARLREVAAEAGFSQAWSDAKVSRIASALHDARREGIEAAIAHVEEHHYQDARLLARGLRALAASGKAE